MDINGGKIDAQLIMYNCHGSGGNQMFGFSKDQTIITLQELCIGINEKLHTVISEKCLDKEQQWWHYDNKVLNTLLQSDRRKFN